MPLPPLHELEAFQQVAKHLSFRKAADALSITPSTLSHLVQSLESKLHIRLFNRTTRSVSLTDEGSKFCKQINPILKDLRLALENVGTNSNLVQGTVRLSVNEVAAPVILDRLGTDFCARYPDIKIELIVENRFIDIVSEGFDAGVRLRDKIPEDMVAVPVVNQFRFVTVAAPHYVNQFGKPDTPQALRSHNCIGFRFQSGRRYAWEYSQGAEAFAIDVTGSFTTNSPFILLKAAKDGHGIAMIAEPLVRNELDTNALIILLDEWTITWPDLELYFPKNRFMSPALRIVLDTLKCTSTTSR